MLYRHQHWSSCSLMHMLSSSAGRRDDLWRWLYVLVEMLDTATAEQQASGHALQTSALVFLFSNGHAVIVCRQAR